MSLVFIFSFFQKVNWVKFYFMSQIKSMFLASVRSALTTVFIKTSLHGYSLCTQLPSGYETQG